MSITPLRAVGLMVGTSLDGVDAALVEFDDADGLCVPRVLAFVTLDLVSAPAPRLRAIAAGAPTTAQELSVASFALARDHERAVRTVCARAAVEVQSLAWVAAHGVTLVHAPGARGGHGWQLLNGGALAAWLDVSVVGDFRSGDIALGGEGAPLAPVADLHLRVSDTEDRIVLNLGGIANLTALPCGARSAREVRAADVGPANLALDELHRRHTAGRESFDRDGAHAVKGRVDAAIVRRLSEQAWVRAPLPRSFGREEFGPDWVDAYEKMTAHLGHDDRLATLVRAQAEAIAWVVREALGSWRAAPERPLRVLLTGGGRHHAGFVAELGAVLAPSRVDGIETIGEDPDAKEALDFALLGGLALRHRAAGAAATTGAQRDIVLGAVWDPRPREC